MRNEPAEPRVGGFADVVSAKEIAFIDPQVDDLATLLSHLRPEVGAILLDDNSPAPTQIAQCLARRPQSPNSVHVIAHGREGEVGFTAGPLSLKTLSEHRAELERIGAVLGSAGGHCALNLWSCEAGAGDIGEAFVVALSEAVPTGVNASTTKIGAANLGGCWELSRGRQTVRPQPPLNNEGLRRYLGLLAVDITISGRIANGRTTRDVTYFILDRQRNAIVGNITLPDASTFANSFRLKVAVPQPSESFDVGLSDDKGGFVSAGFHIEAPPTGAVGSRG